MYNKIFDNFNIIKLLKFAMPSAIMMIFLSLYTIADGFFVSYFIGPDALSAVNIVFPLTCIFSAISLMFATGGNAIISREIGRGNLKKANGLLSSFVIITLAVCILLIIIAIAFLKPILKFLGADATIMPLASEYILIILLFTPLASLQMLFQSFLVTASKTILNFTLTVISGITNIVLDYVFLEFFNMGIAGAAIATGLGFSITAIGGIIYFFISKNLKFSKPYLGKRNLIQAIINGSSEMVGNLASCITTWLFNVYMIKSFGSTGVAAITVILYVQFLLSSLFLGFSMGVAPIYGYNYGAGNKKNLKKLNKICYTFVVITSLLTVILSFFTAEFFAKIFSSGDDNLHNMISIGMKLFSFAYLFMGINIFSSAMFTAISDGLSSALISLLRTFLFTIICILVLPLLNSQGIWLSVPTAEALTLFITIGLLIRYYLKFNKTSKSKT